MSSFTVTTTLSERLGCAPAPSDGAPAESIGPASCAEANPIGVIKSALRLRAAILDKERM
jgi:hypothetical protein